MLGGRISELLYSFNEISIAIRLVLAAFCGGIIGIERERKRRAAGFRTHILICIGAAMTTLIGQFLLTLEPLNPEIFKSDPLRIGAQVIAGMGFIGAGAIIVTRRRQVKGLTTAAGLWTTAIIGLAAGAGCYLEVVFCTFIILIAETLFGKVEYFLLSNSRVKNIYVDFEDKNQIYTINERFNKTGIKVIDAEINKSHKDSRISVIFTIQFPKKYDHDEIIKEIASLESVRRVEEL